MTSAVHEALGSYRDALRTEDAHELAARRRRLLPILRSEAEALSSAADLRTALAVLAAARQSALGPLPEGDVELQDRMAERLASIPSESYRVPVLVVDEGTGEGEVAELVVELTAAPGRGRTVAMGRADEAAVSSAQRAVAAAAALLRRHDLDAESADLEVAWQVGARGDVVAGPSIGLGLALAIVSRALDRPLPADVAVTGELDLDGRAVAVAGLDRKIAAARAAGYGRILVPVESSGEGVLEVADLAEAAQRLWGFAPRRKVVQWVRPGVAGLVVLFAMVLGLLETPAVLGYGLTAASLPPEALSDRVVLVTWSRSDDPSAAKDPAPLSGRGVAPVDLAAFPDHKSYRSAHPVVLGRLAESGAAAVGFDVWFRGGDRTDLEDLREAIEAARSTGTEVVLPARHSAGRWDGPEPALAASADAVASAYLIREGPLGLVRSMELGVRDPEPGAPPWSMAVALVAAAEGATPRWNGPGHVGIGRRTHRAHDGRRLIAFPAEPGYRHYSYADVYAGDFDPTDFEGSIVIVGGRLGSQDRHRTPGGDWYGVELLAASVDSLVSPHEVRPLTLGFRAAILVAMLILVLLVRRRAHVLVWLPLGTVLALALAFQLSRLGLVWPWTDAAALMVAVALGGHTFTRRSSRSLSRSSR